MANELKPFGSVTSACPPRPAAPVEGLVRYDISMFGNGAVEMGGGEYVRFDQAEAIIAAERAEVTALREALIDEQSKRRILETENAALTARVKELSEINVNLMGDDEDKPRYTTKRLKHEIACATKSLETQLAAARKALEILTLHANSLAMAHLDRTENNTAIWKALTEARAALEAKP